MKILIIIALMGISTLTLAQSKSDISSMLDKLKASGTFSDKDIAAAKAKLDAMSDKDVDSLVEKGKEKLNDPKIQDKLKELKQ
jgi:hypothetical protein